MKIFFFLLLLTLPHTGFAKTPPLARSDIVYSYAPLVKKVAPAVVNIYTRKKVLVNVSPFFNDPFFKQFLAPGFQGGVRERVESSLGSGVIVKSNGLIITNYHVIKESDEVTVVLSDKREFQAKVLISDEKVDLALLKIEVPEALPYLLLEDSDTVEVGDLVLAIGNPFGVGQTVTSGIISALARTSVGVSDFQSFIQTDAAINPGNSGGALVTMNGKLAGVNTAIYSSSGGSNGIGFAIPSNMVATIVNNAGNGGIKAGHIIRPWLGTATQTVTKDIAASLNLKVPSGVLISQIYPGGPADNAGLKVGDIIVEADHHDISDDSALHFRIATAALGKTVSFTVLRNGKQETLEVMMKAPPEIPARDARTLKGAHPLSGAMVENLSPALADDLGVSLTLKGVIVQKVVEGDYADRLGVAKGDIIRTINGITIESSRQLEAVIGKQKHGWNMVIQRGDKLLTVAIQ